MTTTESVFWKSIQGDPGAIPDPSEFFSSNAAKRIMELLRVLRDLNAGVGTTRYEVTVKDVIGMFGQTLDGIDMQPVGRSKVYALLRGLISIGLISQQTISTVASYQETPVAALFKGEIADCYIVDVDGNTVMPKDLQDGKCRIFLENGERTLKTCSITEKGKTLLDLYTKHAAGGKQA